MINNTRHTHNETVMERLLVDQTGNVKKLNPNYLIWLEERKTDKFPPELEKIPEENENAKLKKEYKMQLWEKTKKAAYDLGIPIVIINREECAEKENEKIEESEKILRGEKELPSNKTIADVAKDAIVKFENNYVGLEFADIDIKDKYFSQAKRENLIQTAINVFENIPQTEYEKRYEYLSKVTETINQECSKLSLEDVNSDHKLIEYYNNVAKELNEKLANYMKYIGKIDEEHVVPQSDIDKKKKLMMAFGEKSITESDILKAQRMLDSNIKTNEITNTNLENEDQSRED